MPLDQQNRIAAGRDDINGSDSLETSSRSGSTIENVAKTTALIASALYVLGLLITNAYTMELGVSDFADLQIRYVMVGALYLLYVALPVTVVIAPLIFIRYNILVAGRGIRGRARIRDWILTLAGAVTIVLALIATAADVVGYLSPTGRKWVFGTQYVFDLGITFGQLKDGYGYPSVIAGAINLLLASSILVLTWPANQYLRSIFVPLMVLGVIVMLLGYSVNVYPNLSYNLGGGSPAVWQFQVDATTSGRLRSIGLNVTPLDNVSATVGPTSVWHQSQDFVYLSQLDSSRNLPRKVIAITLQDVKSFAVLPFDVHLARDRTVTVKARQDREHES